MRSDLTELGIIAAQEGVKELLAIISNGQQASAERCPGKSDRARGTASGFTDDNWRD
jgi:hypothetical protein